MERGATARSASRRPVRETHCVAPIRDCVPHVLVEHKGDVRHTIGVPMRQSGGVAGGHGADKRQVSGSKNGVACRIAGDLQRACGL